MLPTAIKRKLTLTILCALLMGMSLLLTTHPHTAFAQTASPAVSITVYRAFTTDANGSEKTVFAPSEDIRYSALIINPSDQPITVTLAMVSGGPDRQAIYQNKGDITLPPGQSSWYGQSTIPQDAVSGAYAFVAAVDSNSDGVIESKASSFFTVTPGV